MQGWGLAVATLAIATLVCAPVSAGCITRMDGSRFCSEDIKGGDPPPPPPISTACLSGSSNAAGMNAIRYSVYNGCGQCVIVQVVMRHCGRTYTRSTSMGPTGTGTVQFDFDPYCGNAVTNINSATRCP